jgi:hypothetical protein
MIIHLVDGTYELFRHFYGIRRFKKTDPPFGAVSGVLATVAQLLEDGATHVGVATDHIIESFRNKLWAGYKTGAGVEHALKGQFTPLEEALVAMGVVVWPEVELEADDALASAAYLAAQDERVEKVCIWTPTKISRNAWSMSVWYKLIGVVMRFVARKRCARSLEWRPSLFPTTSLWSVTQRTVIRESRALDQRQRRR